jgi:arylsulfatase A-like enzyme
MSVDRIVCAMACAGMMAFMADAAIKISAVGDGIGYDILGTGAATDEATAYRSTGVPKTFDVDGDNAYGTEGFLMFGDGGDVANNVAFNQHVQVGASWATFSAGTHFKVVFQGDRHGPMDQPVAVIAPVVADWGSVGSIMTTGVKRPGSWRGMLSFTVDATVPQKFRIGLVGGTHGTADGNWDPTAYRLSSGVISATVSNMENNPVFTAPSWVFFDVDMNGETSGTFNIAARQRRSSGGASLVGVTFDVPLNVGVSVHANRSSSSQNEMSAQSKPACVEKVEAEKGKIQPLAVVKKGAQPNIVFIMADDLGPGWVDFDGSHPEINTPNLERLAKSGMVFTKAYAAATVCSPTRAACITGMSPAQIGLTTHIPGKAGYERKAPRGGPRDAETLNHLPLELPSYARELKKLGYATGFLGKWHLAGEGSIKSKAGIVDERYHPEHFGFDSNIGGCAYGQPRSWFSPYHNATIKDGPKNEYLTDRMGSEAVSFIEANKDHPFHLALWFYSVHAPIQAPKDLVKKNGGNAYLAMLESMDHAVGKVLDTLEATGTLDNTLVIFYSDNGGDKPTSWLADKKGSLLEGGLRVPMAVSWPGVIRPGTQCAVPVISMDFFPTFVHAAGGTTKEITQLEGLDLLPLFQGLETLDRDALTWHYPHNRPDVKYYMGSSILQGDWKLYEGHGTIPDALFNLKDDPMETKNLLKQNPELADRLRGKLHTWLTSVNAKMPPRVK